MSHTIVKPLAHPFRAGVAPHIAGALLVGAVAALLSCSHPESSQPPSKQTSQTTGDTEPTVSPSAAGHAAFDPLGGEYPQVMWMCNVFEVPTQVEVRADGSVVPTTNVKAPASAVVGPRNETLIFDSIRAIPGARHLAAPAEIVRFGEEATFGPDTKDKPGMTIGKRSIVVNASQGTDAVVATVECTAWAEGSSTSSHIANRAIPEHGALVMASPGANSNDAWTITVLRPSVLRSVEDYPFQRASAIMQ